MLTYRVREHNKKRHPRNRCYEKGLNTKYERRHSEMMQDVNDTGRKNTNYLLQSSRCCTDEETRRRETYREKEGPKIGRKAQKQEDCTQCVHRSEASSLCYNLQSSPCSRRQRYQVSLLGLLPWTNQWKPNKTVRTRGPDQRRFHLFERSEFLIATCEKKKTDRLCGCVCVCVWMHG